MIDQYFYVKLIVCIFGNNVMVFVISVNFVYVNFDIDNYEMVVYYEMLIVEFLKRFIEYLNEIFN